MCGNTDLLKNDGVFICQSCGTKYSVEEAKKMIVDGGYDPNYGARPLKRYLQKNVETLAAKLMLQGDIGTGDTIVIDVENGKLVARSRS